MPEPEAAANKKYGYPGQWWVVGVGVTIILVVVLGLWSVKQPLDRWTALAAGGLIAIALGDVLVLPTLYFVRRVADFPFPGREVHTATALGWVERLVLYCACVVGQGPLAIGGWFAAKMLWQWRGWREGPESDEDDLAKGPAAGKELAAQSGRFGEGRGRFHLFLMGTALSMLAVVVGSVVALGAHDPSRLEGVFSFGLDAPRSEPEAD